MVLTRHHGSSYSAANYSTLIHFYGYLSTLCNSNFCAPLFYDASTHHLMCPFRARKQIFCIIVSITYLFSSICHMDYVSGSIYWYIIQFMRTIYHVLNQVAIDSMSSCI